MDKAQKTEIHVRPMTGEDLEQVVAIDRLSFSLPWPPSSYHFELYENPSSRLWVAEIQEEDGKNQIVGLVVIWLILDEVHIATIAVHPEYRKRGIGRRLLVETLRKSVQMGAVTATLEVRAGNLAAQRLYKDLGFEVVSTRPRYYVDNNEDALIMTVTGLNNDYLAWIEDF